MGTIRNAAIQPATAHLFPHISSQYLAPALPCVLEHFPILRNQWGFTNVANSDSCCGLAAEASPHDKTSLK